MTRAKPEFTAVTVRSHGGRLADLKSECYVCAAFDDATTTGETRPKLVPFVGLWDTGATGTVITQAVVDQCGLKPIGMARVKGAYGEATTRNVYLIDVQLLHGLRITAIQAVQGDLQGMDVLIGMNIITLGDFAITNEGGLTTFSFRIPSLHTIDYVKQHAQRQSPSPAPKRKKKRR